MKNLYKQQRSQIKFNKKLYLFIISKNISIYNDKSCEIYNGY